ncbi:MAG: FemAB family XrtA/PEP-CTERM system-associated protein [Candidatus Rokuibacteriota bacterium]
MTLSARLLGDHAEDHEAWDRFVKSSSDGTIFHQTAWKKVVHDVFRHVPRYLLAADRDGIRGVLPLFEVRGLLTGRVLVSVPYAVYGGICAADTEAADTLLSAARALAAERRTRYVELRQIKRSHVELPTKELYSTFVRPLDPDPEVNLAAVPRKQRRMIRQGAKHGLIAREGWEFLKEFYEIFLVSRRHLGSPPFPLQLFEAIRDHFGKQAQLLTVWHGDQAVSGVISLFYEDRVMPYYGAALPSAFTLAANDFMYWEVMREASLAGYRQFDFGRSRVGAGSYDFKRHWGFEPEPLAYQYVLRAGADMPNISPSNPKLQLFIRTWKRAPLQVTRWLGPPLTRWLPLD